LTFASAFIEIIISNVDLIYSIMSNKGRLTKFSVSFIKLFSVKDSTYNLLYAYINMMN